MTSLSRRAVLGAVGVAGLGAVVNSAFAQDGSAANEAFLQSLKTSFDKIDPSLELAPVVTASDLVMMDKLEALKGTITDVKDATGKVLARVASYVCQSDNPNNYLGFSARSLTFRVRGITWQAGVGWPVYETYCPRHDYEGGMRFRHHYRHQIVPRFGGASWLGCSGGSGTGSVSSPVIFCVNDGPSHYADNRGTFIVDVIAWA